MRPVYARHELRYISNLPAPSLPTREITRTRRSPQNGCSAIQVGAPKVPLPTAKVALVRYQEDALIDAINLDLKPTIDRTTHFRIDNSRRDLFAAVAIRPPNAERTCMRARSNVSPAHEAI